MDPVVLFNGWADRWGPFYTTRSTRGARHVASSSFAMQRETLLRGKMKPGARPPVPQIVLPGIIIPKFMTPQVSNFFF